LSEVIAKLKPWVSDPKQMAVLRTKSDHIIRDKRNPWVEKATSHDAAEKDMAFVFYESPQFAES
jgi:hypothetical protein